MTIAIIEAANTESDKEATTTAVEEATTETFSKNNAQTTTKEESKTQDKNSREITNVIIDELYEKYLNSNIKLPGRFAVVCGWSPNPSNIVFVCFQA